MSSHLNCVDDVASDAQRHAWHDASKGLVSYQGINLDSHVRGIGTFDCPCVALKIFFFSSSQESLSCRISVQLSTQKMNDKRAIVL